MINIKRKDCCTGCSACINICEHGAISFFIDSKGFWYPKVDLSKCVDCHLCEKVCPVLTKNERISIPCELYAIKNNDKIVRYKSSSGGVFASLATFVLRNGGIVYGAAFDIGWKVKHICITDIENLKLLQGSKYLQSNTESAFKDIKNKLKLNPSSLILYSGTPCQISGLKRLLGKEYKNLYCVEICCHGVPSPKVFQKYLKSIHLIFDNVSFRSKANGWSHYSFELKNKDKIVLCESKETNAFMKGFLHGLYLRPSCYECPNKPFKTNADIVIGDYWGCNKHHKEFNDEMGVSQLLTITDKGKSLYNSVKDDFISIPISWEEAKSGNGNYITSTPKSKRSKEFWIFYSLGLPFKVIIRFSLMLSVKEKFRKIFDI